MKAKRIFSALVSLFLLLSLMPHSITKAADDLPPGVQPLDGNVTLVKLKDAPRVTENPYAQYLTQELIDKRIAADNAMSIAMERYGFAQASYLEIEGVGMFYIGEFLNSKDGIPKMQKVILEEVERKLGFDPQTHDTNQYPKMRLHWFVCVYPDVDFRTNLKTNIVNAFQMQTYITHFVDASKKADNHGFALGREEEKRKLVVELNGKKVADSISPTLRLDATDYRPASRYYMHFYEESFHDMLHENFTWQMSLRDSAYNIVPNRLYFGNRPLYTGVTINFVDDTAYRKLKSIPIKQKIPARNKDQLIYAGGAVPALTSLQPVRNSKTYYAPFNESFTGAPNKQKSPIFRVDPDKNPGSGEEYYLGFRKDERVFYQADPISGFFYHNHDFDDIMIPERTLPNYYDFYGEKVEDEDEINRYFLVDDDIDWPKGIPDSSKYPYDFPYTNNDQNGNNPGNYIIAPGYGADGKLHFMKNYYFTYRRSPAPVKIRKINAFKPDGSEPVGVANATFSLYQAPTDSNTEPYLIAEGLKTDANGYLMLGRKLTIGETRALIKNYDWLGEYMEHGFYRYKDSNKPEDIELTPGNYILRETTPGVAYKQPNNDFTFTVTQPQYPNPTWTSKTDPLEVTIQEFTFTNESQLPPPIQLKKINSVTNKALAGATYALYKGTPDDGQKLHLADLTTNKDGLIQIGKAATQAELEALMNRHRDDLQEGCYFTADNTPYLLPGKYYLIETAAPQGYKLDVTPIQFELTGPTFGTNGLAEQKTLDIKDQRLYPAPFRLLKTSSSQPDKHLAGATFTLYKETTGDPVKVAENLKTDAQGELVFGKPLTVEGYETLLDGPDARNALKDGYFTTDGVTYLMPGKYRLVETAAPVGYNKLADPISFELTEPKFEETGEKLALMQEKTVTNDRIYPAPFELTKVEADNTTKVLPNAVFDLYKGAPAGENTKLLTGLKTDADGKLIFGKSMTRSDYDTLLDSEAAKDFYTKGYFTADGVTYLMPGHYYLVETEAPAGHEKLDKPVLFTLEAPDFGTTGTEAAVVQKITASDKIIPPTPLEVIKLSASNRQTVLAGAEFSLYRGTPAGTHSLVAEKLQTNTDGKLLFGKAFTEEELKALLQSPDAANYAVDGQFTADGLLYLMPGDYYLVETTAPVGYKKLEEPVVFKLQPLQYDSAGKAIVQTQEILDPRIYPAPVLVRKVDARKTSKGLAGAVFELYQGTPDGENKLVAKDLTTDAKGELMLGKSLTQEGYEALLATDAAKNVYQDGYFLSEGIPYLLPGDYYLVETKAPKGYKKLKTPTTFTLKEPSFTGEGQTATVLELTISNKAQPKPTPPGPFPPTPVVPTEPGLPSQPSPSGTTPCQPKQDAVPKTGEREATTGTAFLLLAGAVALGLLRKKAHR